MRTPLFALSCLFVSMLFVVGARSSFADERKGGDQPAAPISHQSVADARKKVSDAEAQLSKAQAALGKAAVAARDGAAASPEMASALAELKEARASYEVARAAALKGIADRSDYKSALATKRKADDAKEKLAE